MNILITNDDGMHAGQLLPLVRWAQGYGTVTVVVPKFEQSGKSHSIELHQDIEAHPIELIEGVTAWAVNSSPADCVRFAVLGLGLKPDLVISGVNRGLNVGTDLIYSGTVAAASEAVALGIPALAFSTTPGNYDQATQELDRAYGYILEHRLLDLHPIYNVNIPPQAGDIRITHQGGPFYSDHFPPVGENRYRPTGIKVYKDQGDDTLDTDAVMHGYISISPLTIDRTDWSIYRRLTGEG